MLSKSRFLIYCAAALCAFAVEPSAMLLENSDVKISRALEKPHVKGSFHDHKVNRVMIYLQDGSQRFEYQDGRKPVTLDWKAGQVAWSPAEGMHSPEVVTDEPFNIIEVELKKPGGVAGSAKLDVRHDKLEFENNQVRVIRMKLGAHQTASLAESRNMVAVFLIDQETRSTDSSGAITTAKHKAGEVLWETPHSEKLENTGDKPLEMLLLELKN